MISMFFVIDIRGFAAELAEVTKEGVKTTCGLRRGGAGRLLLLVGRDEEGKEKGR